MQEGEHYRNKSVQALQTTTDFANKSIAYYQSNNTESIGKLGSPKKTKLLDIQEVKANTSKAHKTEYNKGFMSTQDKSNPYQNLSVSQI